MIKKSNNYFLAIILISSSIYLLWLLKLLNDFPWRYVFTDWIINYEGGYIRRGLLGEISINLSSFLNLNIKSIFYLVHSFIYLLFHLLFYKFFSKFNKNYVFYIICFSPLVFLYPISTFEAFARKEIFYITFFLLNCYLLIRVNNRNIIFFSTNLFVVLSYLIHEVSLFFISFFYLSYFVFLKKKNYKIKLKEFFCIVIVYSILLFLLSIPVTDIKLSKMVFIINQNFFEITEFSGAISWLKRSGLSAFSFLEVSHISMKYLSQNILFLHFIIVFLYILVANNFFKHEKLFFIFTIICFFSPLIIFTVGPDWGRFVYIYYNFCLIFTFYCLYDNKDVFVRIDQFLIIKNLDLRLKILFTISYVSLWTPGIFFYDEVTLFPLTTLIFDLIRYSIKYITLFF